MFIRPGAWKKVLKKLDERDRKNLDTLLIGKWYLFDTYVNMLKIIDRLYGKGDMGLTREMGKFSAEHGLKRIYRFFYKVGSPNFIISRAVKIWGSYYDAGRLEIVKNKKGDLVLQIHDWPEPNRHHCKRVEGWIERSIEMSGGKNVKIREPKCRCKGYKFCEYKGKWD